MGYPTSGGTDDGGWRQCKRKRKRNETGSVDLETFCKMSSDEKLIALFTKLSTVESKQNNLSSVMSPVYDKVDILEDCVNIHARKLKMLSYRSLDLEARSRRNNLIFRGLADCQNENCAALIVDFLMEEMQLEISESHIARAHRLGSLRKSRSRYEVTRRPIIVAFKDYSMTQTILNEAKRLQGKGYRVERDFPVEIAEARRSLWAKLKTEKDKHPRSKLTIAYPAKLVKNGRVIADEFPDWFKVLRTSRVRGFESDESSDDDTSDGENGQGENMSRSRRVFRPWQPRAERGDAMDAQSCVSSDSDTSVIGPTQQNTSQQSQRKVYAKPRVPTKRQSEIKLTERVKINRENKYKNKVPFTNSKNPEEIPFKFRGKHNERQKRLSSLPNPTRGRSISRSCKQRYQQDRPIRSGNKGHVTHSDSTGVKTMNGNSHGIDNTSQVNDTQINTQL